MEAEVGVTNLGAKEHQKLPTATGSYERSIKHSPSEPPKGTNPSDTLISDFWLTDHERINLCYCMPPSFWEFDTKASGD